MEVLEGEIAEIAEVRLIHRNQRFPVAHDGRVLEGDILKVIKNAVANIERRIQIKADDHVAAEGGVGAKRGKHPVVGGNVAILHARLRADADAAETFFKIDDLHVLDQGLRAIAHDRLLRGIDNGNTLHDLVVGWFAVEAAEINRVAPKSNGAGQETIVRPLAGLIILTRQNPSSEDLHPRSAGGVRIRRAGEIAAHVSARCQVDLETRFQRKGIAQLMQSGGEIKSLFRRLFVV